MEQKEGSKRCEPCDRARDRARDHLRRTADQPVTDEEVVPFHCPIGLVDGVWINGYTGSIELVDEDERSPGHLCAKCRTFKDKGIPAWGTGGSSSGGGPGMSPKKAGKQPRKDLSRNSDHAKGYYSSSSARHPYVGSSAGDSTQRGDAQQGTDVEVAMGALRIGTTEKLPVALEIRSGRELAGMSASGPISAIFGTTNETAGHRSEKRSSALSRLNTATSRPLLGPVYPAPSVRPISSLVRPVRADEGSQRDTAGRLSRRNGKQETISKTIGEPRIGDAASGSKRPGRK